MGIKAVDDFNYNGYIIKVRPLSSYEIDICERKGYDIVTPNLAKLIMRIRLKDISITKELSSLPPEMYTSIDMYYKEIDYWIVYHSMKDFQPEDFCIEDVRKMQYVHDIVLKVLGMSSSDNKKVIEVIETEEGVQFAKVLFEFNVPITDEAWKITPLQYKFYELIKNGARKETPSEEFGKMIYNTVLPKVMKELAK